MDLFGKKKQAGTIYSFSVDPESRAYTMLEITRTGNHGGWAPPGQTTPTWVRHPSMPPFVVAGPGNAVFDMRGPRVPQEGWHHTSGCSCTYCSNPSNPVT